MTSKRRTKLIHEGQYVAEVVVELIETGDGRSPYLSVEDAYRLDDVRDARAVATFARPPSPPAFSPSHR